MRFATYVHPDALVTVKPLDQITFVGHSLPHFIAVCRDLATRITQHPLIPPRRTPFSHYASVHDAAYLQALEQMALDQAPPTAVRLSLECTGLWYAIPAYESILGGIYESLDRMKSGSLERAYVFGAGGHHCHRNWGHGYNVVHPLAAGARYAQSLGFGRVLIVDWDVHHGDGTQDLFANDTTVHCISIHSALDLYMAAMNILAEGTTIAGEKVGHRNIPVLGQEYPDEFPAKLGLEGRFYRTSDIRSAFQESLADLPWAPDVILIFSGYDGHCHDQGGGITDFTEFDYAQMTTDLLMLAQRSSCPILSMHGGGYVLETAVASAIAHIDVLAAGP